MQKGTYPLSEKLQSSMDLPVPNMPKEVKQILDLIGDYHKFISKCRPSLTFNTTNQQGSSCFIDWPMPESFSYDEANSYKESHPSSSRSKQTICILY